jgi:PAS domain S-box-containing protein
MSIDPEENCPSDLEALKVRLAHFRHDLRTPINAIIGYSEMLQEDLEDSTQGDEGSLLATIRNCGSTMLSEVDHRLDLTLVEQIETLADAVSVDSFITETLHQGLDASLATLETCGDQLFQMLNPPFTDDLNKILQAAKRLKQTMENHPWSSNQRDLDDGAAPALQGHSPPSATPQYHPPEVIAQILELPSSIQILSDSPLLAEVRQPGTILVVDDNENNRDLLSRQLSRQGYTVVLARHGAEALQMVETHPYDLILLDMVMPVLSGYEVLVQLKQKPHLRQIPVIMISALDEMDSVIRCIGQGAEDYLLKPFNTTLLNARINACLEKKSLREQEIIYMAQRLIAESTPVPILMFRLSDSQIIFANPSTAEIFGVSKSDLLDKTFADFCHLAEAHKNLISNLCQAGKVEDQELRMCRGDESLFWATVSLRPLQLNQEDVALAALWDITQRKQAEVILRENEAKLKQKLAALEIEINEVKLHEEVAEITNTDFFRELKAKAQETRRWHQQQRQAGARV